MAVAKSNSLKRFICFLNRKTYKTAGRKFGLTVYDAIYWKRLPEARIAVNEISSITLLYIPYDTDAKQKKFHGMVPKNIWDIGRIFFAGSTTLKSKIKK